MKNRIGKAIIILLFSFSILLLNSIKTFSQWIYGNEGIYPQEPLCLSFNNKYLLFIGNKNIFLSENNGDNWKDIKNNFSEQYINAVAISKEKILICTSNGLYIREINGLSWQKDINVISKRPGGFLECNDIKCIAIDSNNIFLGISNLGVVYSSNNGESWKLLDNISGTYRLNSFYQIIINEIGVYACTGSGLFKLEKENEIWNCISTNLTYNNFPVKISTAVFWDENILVGTDVGIKFSSDGGKNWHNKGDGLPMGPVDVLLKKNDKLFVTGFSMGLHYANINDFSWKNAGYKGGMIKNIYASDNYIFVLGNSLYPISKRLISEF